MVIVKSVKAKQVLKESGKIDQWGDRSGNFIGHGEVRDYLKNLVKSTSKMLQY